MEEQSRSFSGRHGLSVRPSRSQAREAVPDELRLAILHFAVEAGTRPPVARSLLLDLLGFPPEPDLWSHDDNVLKECHNHLKRAEWFEVYDFAELLHQHMLETMPTAAEEFERRVNRYLERQGFDWKFESGAVEVRGPEAFESALKNSRTAAGEAKLSAAQAEVHEALVDLSRRPNPDITGAVQHAAAALECVARAATGNPKATLGQIIARHPDILPQPLPSVVAKIWGFSSESARHIREGRRLSLEEAELVVGLAAVVASFLAKKVSEP